MKLEFIPSAILDEAKFWEGLLLALCHAHSG
jgi:hypothetical protein